jgi:large subunit ribosomal protein L13
MAFFSCGGHKTREKKGQRLAICGRGCILKDYRTRVPTAEGACHRKSGSFRRRKKYRESKEELQNGVKLEMKTYLAKTGEIERRFLLFDAANQPLGRLAVKIVNALRGKDLPTFTPHVDTGAIVIVINAEKVLLTGNKETGKKYIRWTGYRSGQRVETAQEMRAKHADRLIREAVWGMIPHGRLGRAQYAKLKVYAGAEHPHAAQNPELVK